MAIAVAVLLAGCGRSTTPATTAGPMTVTVLLSDRHISLDRASLGAGVATFRVMNTGTIVHSLTVLRTDLPHDAIPPSTPDGSRAAEPGLIRETGQIAAGASTETSVRLAFGSYVLICNEPAHYLVGMHAAFAVE